MNNLSDAFLKAGYQPAVPAAVRLRTMMRKAVKDGIGDRELSIGYFMVALTTAKPVEAAELLWEMFSNEREAVLARLFQEVAGEASLAVPQGHMDVASLATPTGKASNPMSQDQRSSANPVINAGEAVRKVPQGQRSFASPAHGLSSARRKAVAAAGERRALILSGFTILERQGSQIPIEYIKIRDLPRLIRRMGHGVAVRSVQLNALIAFHAQTQRVAANIPKEATIIDIFSMDHIKSIALAAQAITNNDYVQLPESLRKDAASTVASIQAPANPA